MNQNIEQKSMRQDSRGVTESIIIDGAHITVKYAEHDNTEKGTEILKYIEQVLMQANLLSESYIAYKKTA